jgi:protein involved in temperature-dependent protein secretion
MPVMVTVADGASAACWAQALVHSTAAAAAATGVMRSTVWRAPRRGLVLFMGVS